MFGVDEPGPRRSVVQVHGRKDHIDVAREPLRQPRGRLLWCDLFSRLRGNRRVPACVPTVPPARRITARRPGNFSGLREALPARGMPCKIEQSGWPR